MKPRKTNLYLLIALLIIGQQSFADWVISSGTKVKVPTGKYLKVDGNLKLLSTAKLTNEGIFALNGNFDNQGETILGNGTFRFSGSTAQLFTGTAEFGNVSIESGSSLEIQPGAWATINGTTTNLNGTNGLFVKSDQTGSGSLIHNTTLVQGTVEQYLLSEQWHFVSAPISDAEIGSFLDIYLMDWDELTAAWTYMVDPINLPMDEGIGFSAWADDQSTGSTVVDFAGTLNASDIALNLDYTTASSETGWNLIGNPFSSAIDWNTNWTMNDVGGWALVYDNTVSKGWNPHLPPGSQSYNDKTDGIIPLAQGFWVRATDAGASITLPTSERIHSSQAFYKESTEVLAPTLRLAIEGNNKSDEAVVILLPDATVAFDGLYDLVAFNSDDGVPKLFSMMDDAELTVNVLPDDFTESTNPSVNMGFEMSAPGQCKITASGIASFKSELPIYLEDILENTTTDLRQQPEYTFVTDPLNEVHRFILHFGEPLGLQEDPELVQVQVFGGESSINIKMDKPISGYAKVYDMLGREISEISLDGLAMLYALPAESKTYYVVRIVSDEGVWNEKVYVN